MANSMFKAFENYKNQLEGKATIIESTNIVTPEKKENEDIKTENNNVTKDSTGLIFRIQIETSGKKLATNSTRFKGLEIYEYQENNLFKYCTGLFQNDLKTAKEYKIELEGKECVVVGRSNIVGKPNLKNEWIYYRSRLLEKRKNLYLNNHP
jgi:N-acetylmuramoyl-L-alanine amidase